MERGEEYILELLAPLEHLETLSYNDVRNMQDAITTYFNSVDNISLCNYFEEDCSCNYYNLRHEELENYYDNKEHYNSLYWQDAHEESNDDDDDVENYNQFDEKLLENDKESKEKRAKHRLSHHKEKACDNENKSCKHSPRLLREEKEKELPQEELCNNKIIGYKQFERINSKSPSPHAPNNTLPTCRSLFTSESATRSPSNQKTVIGSAKEQCEKEEAIKRNWLDVLLPARQVEEFDIGRKLRDDAKCKFYEARDRKKLMTSAIVTLKVYTDCINATVKSKNITQNHNFKIKSSENRKYNSSNTKDESIETVNLCNDDEKQFLQQIYNEVKWQQLVASIHPQHVLRLFGYCWLDSVYHASQLALIQEASNAQSLEKVLHEWSCVSVSKAHINIGFVQTVLVQLLHVLVSLHAENIAFGGIHPRHILLETNNTALTSTNTEKQTLTSTFTLADSNKKCPWNNIKNKNNKFATELLAGTQNKSSTRKECNVNNVENSSVTIKLIDFTQTHRETTEDETVEEYNVDLNYTAPEMLNLIYCNNNDNNNKNKKCKKTFSYTCKRGNMASDMWAVGVLCYHMLLNDLPFDDVDEIKMVKLIQGGIVYFPRSVPGQAKDFMQRLLTVETDKRMSARDALSHPFLQESNNNENSGDSIDSSCTKTGTMSDNISVNNNCSSANYNSNSINNVINNNNSSYSNTKTNSNSVCSDSCPVNTMSFAKILSHPSSKKANEADNFLYSFDSANKDEENHQHHHQHQQLEANNKFNASYNKNNDCSKDNYGNNKLTRRSRHTNSYSTVSLPQSPSTAFSLSEISVSSLSVTCKPFPELTPLAHTKESALTNNSEQHNSDEGNTCESCLCVGDSNNKNENSTNAVIATDTLQVSSTSCSNSSSIITSLLTSLSEEMESSNKLIGTANRNQNHHDVNANTKKIEVVKNDVLESDRDKYKINANCLIINNITNERPAKNTSSLVHSMTYKEVKNEREASLSPSPEPRSSLGLSCTDSDKRSVSS